MATFKEIMPKKLLLLLDKKTICGHSNSESRVPADCHQEMVVQAVQ